ncbi:putative transposase [Escherichia coli BCE002_MS12]|nr:putative transposase [Escherichia coli BCE002_MS12]EMX85815.1 putative transposase [Escherichia coli BCE001_MS16]
MDVKQLQALANELTKNIKIPEDLSQFDRLLINSALKLLSMQK